MNRLFIVALFMCYSETPLYCIMWNFFKIKRRKDIIHAKREAFYRNKKNKNVQRKYKNSV